MLGSSSQRRGQTDPFVGGPVGFGPNDPAIPLDQIGIPSDAAFPSRRGMFGARMTTPLPTDLAPTIDQQLSDIPAGTGAAALANLALTAPPQSQPAHKPSFFAPGGTGRQIVGGIADGILTSMGQNPVYRPVVQHQRDLREKQAQQQAQFDHENAFHLWQRGNQVEDRNFKADQPQYFTAGSDRVAYNPATGQSNVLYHGNQPFEDYASALGLEPGSPDYSNALRDYVLRGNGPTAFGYDVGLEDARQRNRMQLRNTPTYAQTHPRAATGGRSHAPTLSGTVAPILAKIAQGQALSPGEQAAIDTYYHRGNKGGRSSHSNGGGITKVATNPQTGEKRGWNGTAWVPIQ